MDIQSRPAGRRLVWQFAPPFCIALLGALCVGGLAREPGGARPGWVERMQEGRPDWTEWRNALRPRGRAADPLTLATEGRTDWTIVIPQDAGRMDRKAADELQLWLRKITGAEFAIAADSEPADTNELSVGRTSRMGAAESAAVASVGPEGYVVAVRDGRVFLLGGGQSGPLPAVFAFLEEDLGVRWYGPALRHGSWSARTDALNAESWDMGDAWFRPRPTLEVSVVRRGVEPGIPIRRLSWRRSYNPWAIRNRINAGYADMYGQHGYVTGGLSVHTFHRLVPPDKYFDEHPEYFSLIDGERRAEHAQICLTNPGVTDAVVKTIADQLRRIPESRHDTRHLVGVSQMDWIGDCQCPGCRAAVEEFGTYGGLQLDFVNRVAARLKDEYPWVTLTTLAYRQSKEPPTADLQARDSVAVRFCTDFGASFNWPYHSFYDDHLAEHRNLFERWHRISDRMHLWVYPHQYRNYLAPMPSIRPVAENIRYFHEAAAEQIYVQQSSSGDRTRETMRYWIWSKLLWDPTRNVEELMLDFIWGYYREAASAVVEYHELLWDHAAKHTDFGRKRNWIYPIHDEAMYRHEFVEKAREILDRGLSACTDGVVRERVELLKAGVVYVESVQLYMQMRDAETPPKEERYTAVRQELADLCRRLEIENVGFFDGTRTIQDHQEWLAEMRKVKLRRFEQNVLPLEAWGVWTFRPDPEDRGVEEGWYRADSGAAEEAVEVDVPAFLHDTPIGEFTGYGWYFTTFELPDRHAGKPIELRFGGVDEQAWIYVNGEKVGEHSLESEFMVGQEVTIGDLRNRSFSVTVPAERLRTGANRLAVRIHNELRGAGIHQPVRACLPEATYTDRCDGAILHEDFAGVEPGGIPADWKRYVQRRGDQVFGVAEVTHYFIDTPTLHLQDQQSHVAVWSASDEVLPAKENWTIQFDFRLTGGRSYRADDAGAIFGLKRGERDSRDFLPLVQLDNGAEAGEPVTLLGLGEVLVTDLRADHWHRLVIRRNGDTWQFFLDDERKKTVTGQDTDLRGMAFGSFRDWRHVARDIHYANLKIGNFLDP